MFLSKKKLMKKNKLNISKYIALGIIAILSVACNDVNIDANPSDNIQINDGITDVASANAAVDGMYDLLTRTNYYGRDFLVVPEVSSDNILISPSNSGRFLAQYQYSVLPTTGSAVGLWRDAYRTINAANIILKNAKNASGASQQQLNEITGQAYAIRALAHFDLVRTYAFPFNTTDASVAPGADGNGGHLGIPILTSAEGEIYKPRETVAKVFDQIIADLEIAIANLPIAPYPNASKINSTVAKGLLAKVYLYKADYQNAYDYADEVIKSGAYELSSNANYIKDWKGDATSSEMLFQLVASAKDNRSFDGLGSIYVNNGDDGNSGYGDLIPTADIVNLYSASDVRSGWFRTEEGVIYNFKFPFSWYNNVPVLRLSEILLIKAEAVANGAGDLTEGQLALDAVKLRADLGASPTSSSGVDLLNEVLIERRKEFAFEGHRMFDIVRTKNNLERTDVATASVIKTINYPDTRMIWPISQNEVDANPNMIQNEGY